jgi:hypothetical protein
MLPFLYASRTPYHGAMNQFGLEFHRFGLAVRAPVPSFICVAALGYREGSSCFDAHQRVNLVMRVASIAAIEAAGLGVLPIRRKESPRPLCSTMDNIVWGGVIGDDGLEGILCAGRRYG